jgi:3-oxoacyl-ACP reductase-like protein
MKTFLIAAAALLAAAPAAAQPPQAPPPSPAPQQAGPGAPQGDITRAQAEQNVRAQLGRLDADHDGVVTDKEIEKIIDTISTAGGPAQIGDRLHQLMTEFGHGGRMAIDDVVKARLAQFDAADTNHDGKLDPTERQAAMAAMRGRAPQR